MLTAIVYSGVVSFILLKVIGLFIPLRATAADEATGLDITMHGEEAYLHGAGEVSVDQRPSAGLRTCGTRPSFSSEIVVAAARLVSFRRYDVRLRRPSCAVSKAAVRRRWPPSSPRTAASPIVGALDARGAARIQPRGHGVCRRARARRVRSRHPADRRRHARAPRRRRARARHARRRSCEALRSDEGRGARAQAGRRPARARGAASG